MYVVEGGFCGLWSTGPWRLLGRGAVAFLPAGTQAHVRFSELGCKCRGVEMRAEASAELWEFARKRYGPRVPLPAGGCEPARLDLSTVAGAFEAFAGALRLIEQGRPSIELVRLPHRAPPGVRQVLDATARRPNEPWRVASAADRAGYSESQFNRACKALMDCTYREYLDRCRVAMAVDELCLTDRPADEVANDCGFGDARSLRTALRGIVGFRPADLRRPPTDLEESP